MAPDTSGSDDQPEAPGSRFHVGKPSREKWRRRCGPGKAPPRAPRAPSLRSLVKLALACDSAEQLGEKLRRRYQRQKQRAGIKTGRVPAETEAELDRLLAQG